MRHAHGELAELVRRDALGEQGVAQVPEAPEPGPDLFGVLGIRRQEHEALDAHTGEVAGARQHVAQLGLVEPGLGGLVGQVDLNEHGQVDAGRDRRLRQACEQVERMDGLEAGEGAGHLVGLVGLEGADEVPAEGQVGGFGLLGQRLLHPVLAEIDLLFGVRGADGVCPEGLADGDQADGLGRPSAADRGAGDARPDGGQPPGQPGVQRVRTHSFGLIESRMPLACAAIAPSGASFR